MPGSNRDMFVSNMIKVGNFLLNVLQSEMKLAQINAQQILDDISYLVLGVRDHLGTFNFNNL